MHYIVHLKYPKFECTYDVAYMLLPYTTMQCGRVFQRRRRGWITAKTNTFNQSTFWVLWFGFAHNIVCTWKKIFYLIYFNLTFINFSFSFNFMHVKSYKTSQNTCACWSNHIICHCSFLKISSRLVLVNPISCLVSSRELSVSSHPFAHNIVYTWKKENYLI